MMQQEFLIVIYAGILMLAIFGVAMIIAVIEIITGTILCQWPEKISGFFK